jgi:hypothetical protein
LAGIEAYGMIVCSTWVCGEGVYFTLQFSMYHCELLLLLLLLLLLWRKLHDEELHNLYSSPSIIRIIKSRRMKWAGHVARMGEKRNAYRVEWTILEWILER